LLRGAQRRDNLALLRVVACFCYQAIFKERVEHDAFLPKYYLREFSSTP
jgi:hypothetical protein